MGLFQLRRRRKKPTRRPKLSPQREPWTRIQKSTQVVPSVRECGPKWKTKIIRQSHPSPSGGVSFRSSMRWFVSRDQLVTNSVPYISKQCKISIYNTYRWRSYPAQTFATVASTLYRRIMNLLLKRHSNNLSYAKGLRNACIKVSLCYAITHHDYIIDRFLGMTRRKSRSPKKVVNGYVHRCVCNLDGDKRFVYSQAYTQANWLKFLVKRPSDKSRENSGRRIGSHLKSLGEIWNLDLVSNFQPVSFKETVSFLETFRPTVQHLCPAGDQLSLRSDPLPSEAYEESLDWFYNLD